MIEPALSKDEPDRIAANGPWFARHEDA